MQNGYTSTPPSARISLICELLEKRTLLSLFTVTNTQDSGPGSLRQAILDSNATPPAMNQIEFAVLGTGVHTIYPESQLPVITNPVTLAAGLDPFTLTPTVELSGRFAGPFADGLVVSPSATGSQIGGLIIDWFKKDALVLQAPNTQVAGCYLGLSPSGGGFGNGGNGLVVSASSAISHCVIGNNGVAGIFSSSDGVRITGCSIEGNGHEGVIAAPSDVIGAVGSDSQNMIANNGYSGILIVGPGAGGSIVNNSITANGGSLAAPYRDGITVLSPGLTIGPSSPQSNWNNANVISRNKGNGIFVSGSSPPGLTTKILGNLIGTDSSGIVAAGNSGNGIVLAAGQVSVGIASLSTPLNPALPPIGGNIIAANGGDGVLILSSNDTIYRNYIGINLNAAAMGNLANGIEIRGGHNNVIGDLGLANTISANREAGVSVHTDSSGSGGNTNMIRGNFIGTDSTGDTRLGNSGNGVEIFGSYNSVESNSICGNTNDGVLLGDSNGTPQSGNSVTNNRIGIPIQRSVGDVSEGANGGDGVTIFRSSGNAIVGDTIEGNFRDGVDVIASTPTASDTIDNEIWPVADFANGRLGIDLGDDGVTPNTPGGATTGPNDYQNYPVILSAINIGGGLVQVRYTLDSPPGTYSIRFYSNPKPDPSGYGPGQTQLEIQNGTDSQTIRVTGTPGVVYAALVGNAVANGSVVTATATSAAGNTSEFAQDVIVKASAANVGQPLPLFGFIQLLDIARNFGSAGSAQQGDLNGDGVIDFADLVLLARNYGRTLAG